MGDKLFKHKCDMFTTYERYGTTFQCSFFEKDGREICCKVKIGEERFSNENRRIMYMNIGLHQFRVICDKEILDDRETLKQIK